MEVQGQQNRIGPDIVGFYRSEILELLFQGEQLLPLSSKTKEAGNVPSDEAENGKRIDGIPHVSTLFSNSIKDDVPNIRRELLKASLRQSVKAITQEVDEVFDPVIRIRHVMSCLKSKRKERSSGKSPIFEDSITPHTKKLKLSSSNAKGELLVDQSRDAEKDSGVSVDMKLLLESEHSLVEGIMAKQSDELHVMLNHMEKQLEELLNAVVSKCRQMTREEKHHLRKLIEKLPARNLDRIVEIIQHGKSTSDTVSSDSIVVDLEEQENTNLWRLYFYVKAVENARKLST